MIIMRMCFVMLGYFSNGSAMITILIVQVPVFSLRDIDGDEETRRELLNFYYTHSYFILYLLEFNNQFLNIGSGSDDVKTITRVFF